MNAIAQMTQIESKIETLSKSIKHLSPDAAKELNIALQHILEAEMILDTEMILINE